MRVKYGSFQTNVTVFLLKEKEVFQVHSTGMLEFFKKQNQPLSIPDFLEHSSYDELIEINLNTNHYKFIYNVADKYYAPVTEGLYSEFHKYAVDHVIHPEDAALYDKVMHPDSLLQCMAQEELKDTFEFRFRVPDKIGRAHV